MARVLPLLLLLSLAALPVPALAADSGGGEAADEDEDEDEDEPFPLHFDFEGAWARQAVRFFSPPDALSPCSDCFQPADFHHDLIRFTAGLGWGVFTLEGSVAVPPQREASSGMWVGTWSAGFRVDTSSTALFSAFFRGAYLQRWGTIPGKGGRVAVGAQVRPVRQFVIFGEGSIDAATVPSFMNSAGTIFSYSMSFTFGGRIVFAK
ncbi:MAG: hypothetical protein ACOC5B_01430 [Myxococcota bacterium]